MILKTFNFSRTKRASCLIFNCRFFNSDAQQPLVDHLRDRGLVAHVSHPELEDLLAKQKVTLYAGADPTAKSLHIGNLIPLMVLLHFSLRGHNPLTLVGGATGEVGDPSGRKTERSKMEDEVRAANIKAIGTQMVQVLNNGQKLAETKGYSSSGFGESGFVNNATWWKGMGMLDFLATYGRHIRVNAMIARDSVKNRLAGEQGLGFNEFSYQVLQAYDFWHLYKTKNCLVQIGGNDQWGNISAGIDLISRLKNHVNKTSDAFGLTVPLLTTPSGEKFGKSAGNAVWLDPSMTKPFDLYQYFVRSPDEAVHKYLKLFTLLPLQELEVVVENHFKKPEERLAQRLLAKEATDLIHGLGAGSRAAIISSVLFPDKSDKAPSTKSILEAFEKEEMLLKMSKDEVLGTPWRSLVALLTGKSKSEATRLIKSKGIYNGLSRSVVEDGLVAENQIEEHGLLLVRVGKANYYVVQVV